MSQPSPEIDALDRPAACPGQYLTFRLAGEEFGVAVLRIREILEYGPLTPVPLTPPWIRGVLNLRGSVVPVVDLALKFGAPPAQVTRRSCIVIVEARFESELDQEMSVLGVLVDAVSQVVELGAEAIEPPPAFGTRVRVEYLSGLGKVEGELVLLLDVDRVLSTDELLSTREVSRVGGDGGGDAVVDGGGAGEDAGPEVAGGGGKEAAP